MSTNPQYPLEVLDVPHVKLLPLGHLDPDGGLTLGDTVGAAHPRGFRLNREYRELLADTELLLGDARRTPEQRALLWWMSNQGMLVPVAPETPNAVLPLIPVLRHTFAAVDDLGEDGYRLHADNNSVFVVDELEARLLQKIDGEAPFSHVIEKVHAELLTSEQNRTAIAESERSDARPFADALALAALRLTEKLVRAGVATVDYGSEDMPDAAPRRAS